MASTVPWYAAGLRFTCTQCGHCCTVRGYVWVDQERIAEMAAYIGTSPEAFTRRYVRRVGERLSLTEKPTGECVFWNEGCGVYPVRPVQCRTFPFWKETLASPAAWATMAESCPGANEGQLYERSEIQALARGESETGPALPAPADAEGPRDAVAELPRQETRPLRLLVLPGEQGQRLDQFLAAAAGVSRREARRAIAAGLACRDGKPSRVQSRPLELAEVVDLLRPPSGPRPGRWEPPELPIVYEDRWVIAVDKPAGMLSQPIRRSAGGEPTIAGTEGPDAKGRPRQPERAPVAAGLAGGAPELACDEALLLRLAGRDGHRPFLRLVHRLDRATSGALLFARSPEALAPLARAWREGEVERRYLAIVEGEPAFERREVDAPIARDQEAHWRFAVAPHGRSARTAVAVVARGTGAALVACSLGSGRTHQVRVHLAHLGHPVAGDRLYGASLAAPRPLLHAASIAFPHPRDAERLELECPVPEDFRWRAAELGIRLA